MYNHYSAIMDAVKEYLNRSKIDTETLIRSRYEKERETGLAILNIQRRYTSYEKIDNAQTPYCSYVMGDARMSSDRRFASLSEKEKTLDVLLYWTFVVLRRIDSTKNPLEFVPESADDAYIGLNEMNGWIDAYLDKMAKSMRDAGNVAAKAADPKSSYRTRNCEYISKNGFGGLLGPKEHLRTLLRFTITHQ